MNGLLRLFLVLSCVFLGRDSLAESVKTLKGTTMGTTYLIRFARLPSGTTVEAMQEQVDQRLAAINRMMSTYDPNSELSEFNRSESMDWFPVSSETASVVAFALEVARESSGKFDPTIGPLVNLWGFGPEKRTGKPPSDAAIAAARNRVGYQHLAVRTKPPALKKDIGDLYVDLSAIAKGYGVDAIAEMLDDLGVPGYMIEIGGEVRTRGKKPDGSTWKIGVENPENASKPIRYVMPLVDESVATSGDYRNSFTYAGRQFSHTIDPATGCPVENKLAIVTVRAPTCMKADAFSTAVLALGPEAGYDWAAKRGLAVLMIERMENGYHDRTTPTWDSALTSR